MNEYTVLLSHLNDLKEKSAFESVVTNSNFLSVDEISEVIKNNRSNNEYIDTYFWGGYTEAERKTAVFIPRFYDVNEDSLEDFLKDNNVNPVIALQVTKDKFSTVSHRDYLGALMGLGLKREMIGDIVVKSDGCTIFCLKSISRFITENLKQAGRAQLSIIECDSLNSYSGEDNSEEVFLSVASLRLDCVVAAAFRLSRSSAAEAINQNLVYVNSVQITKSDSQVNIGDKLVLRGKGKVLITEQTGQSKKGRLHIKIKRYL